jgi:hypothetical protein
MIASGALVTPNDQQAALLQAAERGDYEAVKAIVEKDQSLVHRVLLENGLVGDGASSGVTGSASPVLGDFDVGFWKRVGNAIPGFNFDSVEDQADIETYNSESAFGIDGLTHGDIYDFSMTSAEYLGYVELGLSAGSLRAFIRNLGANNRKYAPNNLSVASSRGTWGDLTATPAAENYANQLVRPGDMAPLPKRSLSLTDLGSLASSEGAEFAVVRINGERYLIRGTSNVTTIPENAKLIGHVHPGEGFMGLAPSSEDISALGLLNQQRSALFNESGAWRTFGPNGPSPYVNMPKGSE